MTFTTKLVTPDCLSPLQNTSEWEKHQEPQTCVLFMPVQDRGGREDGEALNEPTYRRSQIPGALMGSRQWQLEWDDGVLSSLNNSQVQGTHGKH